MSAPLNKLFLHTFESFLARTTYAAMLATNAGMAGLSAQLCRLCYISASVCSLSAQCCDQMYAVRVYAHCLQGMAGNIIHICTDVYADSRCVLHVCLRTAFRVWQATSSTPLPPPMPSWVASLSVRHLKCWQVGPGVVTSSSQYTQPAFLCPQSKGITI
jgi:hypothetical protein